MTETTKPMPTNSLRALYRVVGFFVLTLWHSGLFMVEHLGRSEDARFRRSLHHGSKWSRRLLRLFGVRVTIKGPPPPEPALLAPNHNGYLDIFAIFAGVETFMLARTEVTHWPILGPVAKRAGHPLVQRARNRALTSAGEGIAATIARGHRICVFLEGTSTGHDRILPFRPSFVQPAIDAGVPIVPVGIRWRATEPGIDLGEDVSYWKDHVIGPHFWRFCGLRGIEVEVTFGEPIPAAGRDRKELAREAREAASELSGLPCIDEPGWTAPSPSE